MDNKVIIRLATTEDVGAVTQCAQAAYHKYIVRIGRQPAPMLADYAQQIEQQQVHVLLAGRKFGGFAVCYPAAGSYFLENIAVHPSLQSGGYGIRLLKYVESLAFGFDKIALYTNEKMVENLHWYQQHGYTETKRVTEDGFARVYFEKRL